MRLDLNSIVPARDLPISIFLDGVKQTGVLAIDTEAGTLTRYKEGRRGEYVVDCLKMEFETETVSGNVQVVRENEP